MRMLHHWRLDPFSRQARLALAEKRMKARLVEERVWDGRQDFLALNPAGTTPVLVLDPGPLRTIVVGSRAILEFLEEVEPEPALIPGRPAERAEARRIADWFDRKYDAEVNSTLLFETIAKRMMGQGAPAAGALAAGREALRRHVGYVSQLAEGRGWLAGDRFTIADIAAAAHLSCADYLGAVAWSEHLHARLWYDRVQARPSFQTLAGDMLPGMPPAPGYGRAEL